MSERLHYTLVHFVTRSASIDRNDKTAFPVQALPVPCSKSGECALNARVKIVAKLFDTVWSAAMGGARHSFGRFDLQHDCEIGNQSRNRERIRRANFLFRKSASIDLIRVSGKEEAIHQYNYTALERRVDFVSNELGSRSHEEKRFGTRSDVLLRIEEH